MTAKEIELLSPAKNLEIGIAAINHGADAVYIGYKQFGARSAAGNSLSDIEKLVKYAHLFNAKVYVTLNTILYDNELNEVQALINQFYLIGVDAIIIQDMAILEMDLPPIPLHASTQAHNKSIEKVKFLEQVGLTRVVLARELSIDNIAQISAQSNIELEVFIHGSLCVSYSGQCYLSQVLTGRSANRGECAQPCRSTYDLVDEHGNIIAKNKHLISLKDLNQTENIRALIKAGATSLKIEGRLKNIDYVKNITAHYRKIIDSVIATDKGYKKASSGTVTLSFSPDPERSFNRGYSTYFSNGKTKGLASLNTPKSVGKKLGKVTLSEEGWFEIESNEVISNNDGLCYFSANGRLNGVKVNNVHSKRIEINSKVNISPGTTIFRNYDHEFRQILDKTNTAKRTIEGKIGITINHQNITITLTDEDKIETIIENQNVFEPAKNTQVAMDSIRRQMSKTSSTPYNISKISIVCTESEIPYIPISLINEWRRDIIELHNKKRVDVYQRYDKKIFPNNVAYPDEEVNYLTNVSNNLAKKFYERHNAKVTQSALELLTDVNGLEVMRTKYCIAHELGMCHRNKLNKSLFLKNKNQLYPIVLDCSSCEMRIIFPY
ncbi:MAG: U32 family peptidase [Bacteroidales bacterium]|nr:U32 family peptidase [Bacteroidales bacterium]MDD3892503.1 U32 family peptidase [Bacteroidales bacterium]